MSQNGHHYPGFEEQAHNMPEDEFSAGLTDEIDHQILMHRDAHFGGDFGVMLNYYSNEDSVGIDPDFDIDRIAYLAEVEKELSQDLAAVMLSGAEAEAVARARTAYSQLKEIYNKPENEKNKLSRLIADLILTEEEEPEQELENIIEQQETAVPHLIALISSDDMYDPLFPGYGLAPSLAMLALGEIGDSRAVIPIFEVFSREIVFDELVIVEALAALGTAARDFLVQVLQGRPITQDTIHAAFALMAFSDDEQVARECFEQLLLPEVQEKPLLCSYLVNNCDSLVTTELREPFIQMAKDHELPVHLRKEMHNMIKGWENNEQ